jgi:hypothetical protein
MAVFPSTLPCVTEFRLTPAGQRADADPPGYSQRRNRTRSGWALADVEWFFLQSELDTFEAFFKNAIHRGAAWFLMVLPITPEATGSPSQTCYSVVRFPDGYSSPVLHRQGYWRVRARIEIRDRFECALVYPIPGGTIAFSSGTGATALKPNESQVGDALILFVLTASGGSVAMDDAAGWEALGPFLDSSAGSVKCHVFFRYATLSDDVGYTVTNSAANSWAIASIHGVDDQRFPDTMIEDDDYKRRQVLDLGAVTKVASAHHLAFACGFMGLTSPGTAALAAPPAGYTQVGDTVSFVHGAVTRQAMYCYKTFIGDAIDDGAFADGSGTYGGGGTGSIVVVLRYVP